MIPLHLTAWSALAAYAIGTGLDRGLRLGLDRRSRLAGIAQRIFLVAVIQHAVVLHWALGAAVVVVLASIRWRPDRWPVDAGPEAAGDRPERLAERRLRDGWTFGASTAVALWIVWRPAVPLYWDEFVWLAKARLAAVSPEALQVLALRTDPRILPHGYPLLWSELAGWLGAPLFGWHLRASPPGDIGDVVAGSTLATLLSVVAFAPWVAGGLSSLREEGVRPAGTSPKGVGGIVAAATASGVVPVLRGACTAAAAAIVTPLVWVHLRSAYADLPLGLLTAAFTAALWHGEVGSAVVLAAAVTGFKDEGFVHVLVAAIVLGAHALGSRPHGADPRSSARLLGRRVRASLTAAITMLLMVGTHRWLLGAHHVRVEHHTLGELRVAVLPTLLQDFVEHAAEIQSQGITWLVVVACVLAARFAPPRSPRGPWSVILLLQTATLLGAFLVGPDAVRAFALSGTVFHRLLLQLLPSAWLLIHATLAERAQLPNHGT